MPLTQISAWTGGPQADAVKRAQAELKPVLERPNSAVCIILGNGPELGEVVTCVTQKAESYAAVLAVAWVPDLRVLTPQQLAGWANGNPDFKGTCFLTRSRRVHIQLGVDKSKDPWDVAIHINGSVGAP